MQRAAKCKKKKKKQHFYIFLAPTISRRGEAAANMSYKYFLCKDMSRVKWSASGCCSWCREEVWAFAPTLDKCRGFSLSCPRWRWSPASHRKVERGLLLWEVWDVSLQEARQTEQKVKGGGKYSAPLAIRPEDILFIFPQVGWMGKRPWIVQSFRRNECTLSLFQVCALSHLVFLTSFLVRETACTEAGLSSLIKSFISALYKLCKNC